MPSQANLGQGSNGPALVYALGTIGYDFGSEAQQDSLAQAMTGATTPTDASGLLSYLETNPYEATAVIWTLNQDGTPIYAIQPAGPFANVAYERLREFLGDQVKEGIERVSVPGYLAGSVRLMSGQVVPVVVPEPRGMFSWHTSTLVSTALGEAPKAAEEKKNYEERQAGIYNFLERVYYELRNLGLTPQERAVNYAATNAFQVSQVFASAVREELALGNISVERSPICRPGSDCWDVKLTFFAPRNRLERANQVFRIAVDVSSVVPATVGAVRSWAEY
jgi:cyanobactin maturation PatA/PatG family protease